MCHVITICVMSLPLYTFSVGEQMLVYGKHWYIPRILKFNCTLNDYSSPLPLTHPETEKRCNGDTEVGILLFNCSIKANPCATLSVSSFFVLFHISSPCIVQSYDVVLWCLVINATRSPGLSISIILNLGFNTHCLTRCVIWWGFASYREITHLFQACHKKTALSLYLGYRCTSCCYI